MQIAAASCRIRTGGYALLLVVVATVATSTLETQSVFAQPEERRFGLGVTVGDFSGLAFIYHLDPILSPHTLPRMAAIDLNLAIEFRGDFTVMSHLLFGGRIPGSELLYFVGPGFVFGSRKNGALMGGSSSAGVLFMKRRFDVFMSLFPQIIINPGFRGRIEWAVGLRYYL